MLSWELHQNVQKGTERYGNFQCRNFENFFKSFFDTYYFWNSDNFLLIYSREFFKANFHFFPKILSFSLFFFFHDRSRKSKSGLVCVLKVLAVHQNREGPCQWSFIAWLVEKVLFARILTTDEAQNLSNTFKCVMGKGNCFEFIHSFIHFYQNEMYYKS